MQTSVLQCEEIQMKASVGGYGRSRTAARTHTHQETVSVKGW